MSILSTVVSFVAYTISRGERLTSSSVGNLEGCSLFFARLPVPGLGSLGNKELAIRPQSYILKKVGFIVS
jgi:hypothetical protein